MNLLFSDGDSIACIGDSNTSAEITQITYSQFLQYLYITRFPKCNIRFINCGIAGDTYSSAIKRLDWDMLPHSPTRAMVHLGTNDICYQQYPRLDVSGNELGTDHEKVQKIQADCIKMINTLLQTGIQPSIILPGGFYEGDDHPCPETFRGANKALQEFSSLIKDYYANSDVPVIDLFPAFEIMRRLAPATTITPDRVHFQTMMHLLIAAVIAENQMFHPIVASTRIGKVPETYGSEIKDLCVSKNTVTFTYAPHSLPFYNSPVYQQLEQYYPFTQKLNQELIIVEDLQPGYYELILNGTPAGCYTAEEFAKGVNIATISENPNLVLSKELYHILCTDWYTPMHDLRRLAFQIEHCLDLGIDIKRIPGYHPQDTQDADPAFLKFAGGFYATIIELFQNQVSNENLLEQLWQQALNSARPKEYTVSVKTYTD